MGAEAQGGCGCRFVECRGRAAADAADAEAEPGELRTGPAEHAAPARRPRAAAEPLTAPADHSRWAGFSDRSCAERAPEREPEHAREQPAREQQQQEQERRELPERDRAEQEVQRGVERERERTS